MIPERYVSQNPEKPVASVWRSLLGTGFATALGAFLLLVSTWGYRQWESGHFVLRPGAADHYLLAPLVNSGPVAWLIASLTVGVIAVFIHFGLRWWRSSR